MSKGKVRDLNDGFSVYEQELINRFLNGESIRSISENNKLKMNRTAIKNLIDAYKTYYPEYEEKINNRLFENKNNKKKTDEIKDISEEEIIIIYNQIINEEKTLTQVSKEIGRTRDYIKRRIYKYLDNSEPQKIQEFNEKLKQNRIYESELKSFMELSYDEKKEYIFEKVNSRRIKNEKNPYKNELLENKFNKIKDYFLNIRNSKFEEQLLTEEDFWNMLYDTPTLLAYSLSDKIIPAINNLDDNENIGPKNATQIIIEDSSILASSIPRVNLQIKILVDNGMLNMFLKKPRYFRTSPELIYGLIKFGREKGANDYEILLTDNQLYQKYSIRTSQIKQKYNLEKEYGDDEYFDK